MFLIGVLIERAEAAPPQAKFSVSPDKSIQAPLDGATVEDPIYVFVPGLLLNQWEFTWNKNPDEVDGYRIFKRPPLADGGLPVERLGPDILSIPANMKKTESIKGSGVFDKDSVFYNVPNLDLNLPPGSDVCFGVKAYTSAGESGFSNAVCLVTADITDIVFYLDDPTMSGAPFHRESSAPWDLLGDNAGIPIALDVSTLTPGDHVLTTIVNYTEGAPSAKQEATFTVVKKLPHIPTGLVIIQKVEHED